MWLSGLHIPESYLTSLVQATCRKNGWPLDKSTLYTNVTQYATAEDVSERAHQGKVQGTAAFFISIPYVLRIEFYLLIKLHFYTAPKAIIMIIYVFAMIILSDKWIEW